MTAITGDFYPLSEPGESNRWFVAPLRAEQPPESPTPPVLDPLTERRLFASKFAAVKRGVQEALAAHGNNYYGKTSVTTGYDRWTSGNQQAQVNAAAQAKPYDGLADAFPTGEDLPAYTYPATIGDAEAPAGVIFSGTPTTETELSSNKRTKFRELLRDRCPAFWRAILTERVSDEEELDNTIVLPATSLIADAPTEVIPRIQPKPETWAPVPNSTRERTPRRSLNLNLGRMTLGVLEKIMPATGTRRATRQA